MRRTEVHPLTLSITALAPTSGCTVPLVMGLIGQDCFWEPALAEFEDARLWLRFVRVFQPFLAIFAGKSNHFGLYLYNLNDIN